VRRDGFAFCNEEYEPGLRALAVPVLRPNGFAFASITAIAPGERFSDEEGNRQVVERMKEAAVKVGKFMY
ncbi:MAG: IclR family transcriptional regulator C-terminal domain-containing protein, partial [Thermotogota bacterium]|nr:IclR family transcriptional regulator C-terminal domain-containing protein [Thermotogota bacterium]